MPTPCSVATPDAERRGRLSHSGSGQPSARRHLRLQLRDLGGEAQGQTYIRRLFACFEDIAARRVAWRAIPAEFGVEGFYVRCEHHYVYWRILSDGGVGIVTILHERMHQIERFRDDAPG